METAVKRLRTALGMNQTDFARAIGRSHQSVRNYEAGVTPPPEVVAKMEQLAKDSGVEDPFVVEPRGQELVAPRRTQRAHQAGTTSAIDTSDDSRWHGMLDEVLTSGNVEAIAAVQHNLIVFSKFVRRPRGRLRKKAQ